MMAAGERPDRPVEQEVDADRERDRRARPVEFILERHDQHARRGAHAGGDSGSRRRVNPDDGSTRNATASARRVIRPPGSSSGLPAKWASRFCRTVRSPIAAALCRCVALPGVRRQTTLSIASKRLRARWGFAGVDIEPRGGRAARRRAPRPAPPRRPPSRARCYQRPLRARARRSTPAVHQMPRRLRRPAPRRRGVRPAASADRGRRNGR